MTTGKSLLIIPCYNESLRLPQSDLLAFLDHQDVIDLLLVNDGSTDDTLLVLQRFQSGSKASSRIHVLDLGQNGGKAEAVRRGMLYAYEQLPAYELIGFWDADGAVAWMEALDFRNILIEKPDLLMVMGCRVRRMGARIERTTARHIASRVIATIISNILMLPVYDTQCGAKLLRRAVIPALFSTPFHSRWLFDVEMIARLIIDVGYTKIGQTLYEHPLKTWLHMGGSKISLFSMLKVPRDLFMEYKSYHFRLRELRKSATLQQSVHLLAFFVCETLSAPRVGSAPCRL
ncbi:MAG: glycosyltransferase [Sphingobacteriia bacterium]